MWLLIFFELGLALVLLLIVAWALRARRSAPARPRAGEDPTPPSGTSPAPEEADDNE